MDESELIGEQLKHMVDLLKSELAAVQRELEHSRELSERRLQTLEDEARDHENRLRILQESATQFKMLAGLATGGGLISMIALLRMVVN